jgi:hypothetical protein
VRRDARRQLDAFAVHVWPRKLRAPDSPGCTRCTTSCLADLDASEFDFSECWRGVGRRCSQVTLRRHSWMSWIRFLLRLDGRERLLEVLEQLVTPE